VGKTSGSSAVGELINEWAGEKEQGEGERGEKCCSAAGGCVIGGCSGGGIIVMVFFRTFSTASLIDSVKWVASEPIADIMVLDTICPMRLSAHVHKFCMYIRRYIYMYIPVPCPRVLPLRSLSGCVLRLPLWVAALLELVGGGRRFVLVEESAGGGSSVLADSAAADNSRAVRWRSISTSFHFPRDAGLGLVDVAVLALLPAVAVSSVSSSSAASASRSGVRMTCHEAPSVLTSSKSLVEICGRLVLSDTTS
jgi:hypothetical protein